MSNFDNLKVQDLNRFRNIYTTLSLIIMTFQPGLSQGINSAINNEIEALLPAIESIYFDLHSNPELSLQEYRTAAKMAAALRKEGFEVTTDVGGNGVVGVYRNGNGPVLMLRTDMDALPIKETTGLSYESRVTATDSRGVEGPVMHACGHDMHMSLWLGTLKTLIALKDKWHGTIVAVAQPAEEMSAGSQEMINDGLYSRFPKPDYALAWHVSADLPAGKIGYFPGTIFAGVNSLDIKVFGEGGHGAMPHKTIDPVVLSARIILDYQTIVSREINPIAPAVVTVGSIHGGSRHNIIPSEVDLQLTIRFFSEDIYKQILEAISRISRGVAISAGLPDELMPRITVVDDYTPPVSNDPGLVERVVASMNKTVNSGDLVKVEPSTVAEDFGEYGLTPEKVKIALFWLGSVNKQKYYESIKSGKELPPLHNSSYAPDFQATFRTGVSAMTRAAIDLLQ